MSDNREHYSDGRRFSHIHKAWILESSWNDVEEIASLQAALASQTKEIEEVRELLRSGTEDFNRAAAAMAAKDAEIARVEECNYIALEVIKQKDADIERLNESHALINEDFKEALADITRLQQVVDAAKEQFAAIVDLSSDSTACGLAGAGLETLAAAQLEG